MEAAQARLNLHLSKCHIVGNHMPWLILLRQFFYVQKYIKVSIYRKSLLKFHSKLHTISLMSRPNSAIGWSVMLPFPGHTSKSFVVVVVFIIEPSFSDCTLTGQRI